MTQKKMTQKLPDLRSHFGFTATPFTREIAVEKRWPHKALEETVAELRRTIEQRMSAVLIAPSGCGKTLVLRTLRAQLPQARYRTHDVKVTSLSKRDMCREIATAVGTRPAGTYPTLLRNLQEHFLAQTDQEGLHPVLLIDEAQDMRPEVLAVLRILTNFEMDSRLVLSLVLAGDRRLQRLLEHPDLLPLAQRISHFASLRPLSRAETLEYMKHRIHIAGGSKLPFDEQALEAVYEMTRGNCRALHHLSRKSLELAAQQALPVIDASLVLAARKQLPV